MSQANSPATILVVDDDRGMLRLIEKSLQREGFRAVAIASGREAIEWLTGRRADLMLLDLKLADTEGGELVNHLESIGRSLPFVVITGQGDERVAVEMMKRGALDYLVKDVNFIEFIPTVVRRALDQIAKDERLQSAEQQARLADTVMAQTYSGVMITTAGSDDPEIVYVNQAFADVTGTTREKLEKRHLHELEAVSGEWPAFRKVLANGKTFVGEKHFHPLDGGERFADCTIIGVRDPDGRIGHWAVFLHDVTARKLAEEKVLEGAGKLRRTLDSMLEGCQIIGFDWRYQYVNAAAAAHNRQPVEALLDRTVMEAHPGIERTEIFDRLRSCMNERKPRRFENEYTFPDGFRGLFDLHILPVPEGIQILSYDTTKRKQAEEELRQNERALTAFFEHSPIGLIWAGPDGRVIRVNRAQLEMLDRPAREVLDHPLTDFDAGNELTVVLSLLGNEDQSIHNRKALLRRKDKTIRHVLIDATTVRAENRIVRSDWFVRDITPRVELEREVLSVVERERHRFGQDLHDDLCQMLTGIAFRCDTLAQTLPASARAATREVKAMAGMIREATSHAREMARGLSPLALAADGLATALRELARRTTSLFHIDCRLHEQAPVTVDDEATGIHLYRIAQEAVGNAVKHGRPRHIEIELTKTGDTIILTVKDDGRGLPKRPRKTRGMGLRVMQYRAGVIGGILVVQRGAKGGTSVVCTVGH